MNFYYVLVGVLLISNVQAYQYEMTVDPITDEVFAKATFTSNNYASKMIYSCSSGTPEIDVIFNEEVTAHMFLTDLTVRFDKNEPKEIKSLSLFPSHSSYEAASQHYSLIKDLLNSSVFAIRSKMLGTTLATAVFENHNFKDAFRKVNRVAGCPRFEEHQSILNKLQEIELQKEAKETEELEKESAEKAKYIDAIMKKVNANWLRPPNTPDYLSCEVRVRLGANGSVLTTSIIKSSGDLAFDRSVESAVSKSDPLPVPSSPTLLRQFRDIRFNFQPK